MRHAIPFTLGLLVLAAAARPQPVAPPDLPADTRWYVHLDLKRLLGSDAGAILRDIAAAPNVSAKLAAFRAMFGVDLMADVHTITLAGDKGEEQSSAVYVQGRFDREKLITILRAADGHAEEAYGKYTVHRWKHGRLNVESHGAFAREDLIVVSAGQAALRRALDALAGGKGRFVPPAPGDAVLIGSAKDVAQLANDPKNVVARNLQELSLSVTPMKDKSLEVTLIGRAADSGKARAVAQVLEGLRSFALLNAEEEPNGAALAERISIKLDGASVTASLSLPPETMRQLKANASRPATKGK